MVSPSKWQVLVKRALAEFHTRFRTVDFVSLPVTRGDESTASESVVLGQFEREFFRNVTWGLVGLVVVYAWLLSIAFVIIGGELWMASRSVSSLDGAVSAEKLFTTNPAGLRTSLDSANGNLDTTNFIIDYFPGLKSARSLPLVGSTLGAVLDIETTAQALVTSGRVALNSVSQKRAASDHAEMALRGIDQASIVKVNSILAAAEPAVRRLDSNTPQFLTPIARKVTTVFDRTHQMASKAAGAVSLWQSLTTQQGEHTYLVAVRNVSELRADGGSVLSLATLTTTPNGFTTSDVKSVSDFPKLIEDVPPDDTVPEWFTREFTNYTGLRRFQNAPYSPDFTGTGPSLRRMYERVSGTHTDGVIGIDAVALKELLSVIGPVTAQDRQFDAGNITPFLSHDMYTIDNSGPRQSLLGDIWSAAFAKLQNNDWPEGQLLAAMDRAVSGGHVQFWSADGHEQFLAGQAGIDGSFATGGDDYLFPSLQNHLANKLDYWMRRHIDHTVTVKKDGTLIVDTSLTIKNESQNESNPYVLGEANDGLYRGVLVMYVPLTAQMSPGNDPNLEVRAINDRLALRVPVDVPPGDQIQVHFKYNIPRQVKNNQLDLVFQPQATATPDTLNVKVTAPVGCKWDDGGRIATFNYALDSVIRQRLHLTDCTLGD